MFIDFSKLQENADRNNQGTGLGLSICKSIIEQMGGSVKAESTLGEGTAFIITMKTKCRVTNTKFSKKCKQDLATGNWVFVSKDCKATELDSCIINAEKEVKATTDLSLNDQKKLAPYIKNLN